MRELINMIRDKEADESLEEGRGKDIISTTDRAVSDMVVKINTMLQDIPGKFDKLNIRKKDILEVVSAIRDAKQAVFDISNTLNSVRKNKSSKL